MFHKSIFKNPASTPLAALLAVVFLLNSTQAAMADASTLGDIICNAYANTEPFGKLFSWFAYLAGVVFVLQGITHFRAHTENPHSGNSKLITPLMLWAGAALLLALPSTIGMIITSLYVTSGSASLPACSAGASGSAAGLDGMMTNFIGNIKAPAIMFVSVISIMAGIYMIVHGLIKASKYGFDPKTHSVHSILSNVIFGALLMTIGDNLNMMMSSVFGTTTISTSSVINWSYLSSLAGGTSTQFQNAVIAGLSFVQIIGAIAFVRGWMVMKKVVEGGGNATMAQGVTHIIGGVLAINIYAFLKAMDTTFGTGML